MSYAVFLKNYDLKSTNPFKNVKTRFSKMSTLIWTVQKLYSFKAQKQHPQKDIDSNILQRNLWKSFLKALHQGSRAELTFGGTLNSIQCDDHCLDLNASRDYVP